MQLLDDNDFETDTINAYSLNEAMISQTGALRLVIRPA